MAIGIGVDHVSHAFAHNGAQLRVLDDVSLTVAPGEMVCLLGPSGCGKSTLLNIAGGLLKADAGEVRIGDTPVSGVMPQRVGFVFQENALFPWSTVWENLIVGLEFQGVPAAERAARATQALTTVGMSDFAKFYPDQLSGGMKQRVGLARALALQTDVLLMDEPFAALDEQTRMILGEDLSVLLSETGKTIVMVTHSLSEAVFLSDRIFVMTARPGRIKAIVDVKREHPRRPDFMTSAQFNDVRAELYTLLHDEMRAAAAIAAVLTVQPLERDSRSRAIQIAFFVLVLAAWWTVTGLHKISPLFLPAPAAVAQQIGRIAHAPTLALDIFYTLGTFIVAYTLAVIAGLAVGYVVSTRRFLTRVYEPLLASLYAIPIVVFFPTFILFFGTGPNSKIALGALYAFFPIALNTIAGFTQVDYRLIAAARSMGANDTQLLRRVLIPAAFPIVATGMRIAFIACFASILAGEMIASDHGLGHQIAQAGQMMEIARMFGYVTLVVLAAFAFNFGVSALEARRRPV